MKRTESRFPKEPHSLLSPEKLAEVIPLAWGIAIKDWENHDHRSLANLLRSDGPIPPNARAWLAGLVEGKAKKVRNRPKAKLNLPELPGKVMRELEIKEAFKNQLRIEKAREIPAGMIAGTAKDRALEVVAEQFGLTPDKVSQIVYPRKSGVKK